MNTAEGRVASALKGAVGSCLVTHKSPFRLSQEAGRASRLEASTAMVKRWLFTGGQEGQRAQRGRGQQGGGSWGLHQATALSRHHTVSGFACAIACASCTTPPPLLLPTGTPGVFLCANARCPPPCAPAESFLGWSRLYTPEGALTGTGLTLDTLPSSSQWAEHEAQLREDCHKVLAKGWGHGL